ncbi:MAG TPA: diacylglycerol kinase family protein [Candidatus Limnocylindrales bacterium]|nr:diacylglycerol kinase family protein [Candidatus Limnocylindrales bacterium]
MIATEAARIRVIWNPAAGSKGGLPLQHADEAWIRDLMHRAKLGEELVEAPSPAEARSQAGDAASRGYDLVVAAGGDGTVATVATELLGSSTVLGILPLGSVMNIARSVGLPRDPVAAAEVIATGRVAVIDVGEVRGRPFFESGSVGMNAAMFREAHRIDEGDWSSIARTVWAAIRYRPARMAIDLEDRRIRTRALMVTVSNGPYVGAGMTVAPNARLDDGCFDVRVFRRFSKFRLLRHLVSIAFGRYRYAPEIDTYRSRFVRIESAHPLPARADSRDLGTTPIEFVTRPAALRVLVPDQGPVPST